MTRSKRLHETRRLRTIGAASVLAVMCSLGTGSVLADSDSVNDSAKQVGNNFGELLKGMGQELKKAGGSLSESGKKDNNKETKHPDKKTDQGKENNK